MDIFIVHAAAIASAFFILIYVAVTFEHYLGIQKEPVTLIGGVILQLYAHFTNGENMEHALEITAAEIFHITTFLLAAMTLVEFLDKIGFFELIRFRLLKLGLADRQQFYVISFITFFMSAVLDNLTTTLVMITIVTRFFSGYNRLIATSGTVANANAGGAWSPIGDVTTIMLWVKGKFTTLQIITHAFLPAVVHSLIVTLLLGRKFNFDETPDSVEDIRISFTRKEKFLMGLALGSFSLPLVASQLGLPPYMGLLFGLGVVWLFNLILSRGKEDEKPMTHMEHDIEEAIRAVDHRSLLFFTGILLSVSALKTIGVLEKISGALFGENASETRIIGGNVLLGLASAIVDNVPLTALAIDVVPTSDPWMWTLLALAVGTGGSALIIGSVAGVVAMGRVKELTSAVYMRIATVPVLLGYTAQIIVWLILFKIFS